VKLTQNERNRLSNRYEETRVPSDSSEVEEATTSIKGAAMIPKMASGRADSTRMATTPVYSFKFFDGKTFDKVRRARRS
jgi:hypothetical protein